MNEPTRRFKVKVFNSKENLTSLSFPDLSVKYSNGYSEPIKVREGYEIPLDVLDEEDIRKSLKVGSLRKYLDSGWVVEIFDNGTPVPTPPPPAPAPAPVPISGWITEGQMTAAPVAPPSDPSSPSIVREGMSSDKSKPQEPLTDLSLVLTYDDFCRLSHFLKLRFIKESTNVSLLKDILQRTPSTQFKNNIQVRLNQLLQ